MARRRSSRTTKIQPSVLTMNFQIEYTGDGDKESAFIDLSQCASLLNRRFYRQGLNWAVSGFKILSESGVSGQVGISKLPNTWIMSNSWEKSFRAWSHMIDNATDEQGLSSIKGKFLDFKIYADDVHHGLGFAKNLLPVSAASDNISPQTASRGQWQPSEIEIPSTTGSPGSSFAYELIAVGPNTAVVGDSGLFAKSIIGGYEVSRALPAAFTDPNVPADASDPTENWILGMFTDGSNQDTDVVQMLETTGDRAPYPYENDTTNFDTMYPGGENQLPGLELHDFEFVTSTTIGGTTRFKGGNFPCGLVSVNMFGFSGTEQSPTDLFLQVELVPGTHRGYLCEPMTEM